MLENLKPKHVAIVMDGNGRWASRRDLPRLAGHEAGSEAVQHVIKACAQEDIEVLTLFAFSSENWGRPDEEVSALMELFSRALQEQTAELHKHGVQVRFIGNLSAFDNTLQQQIQATQQLTASNTKLTLVIAVNYSGQWDIAQAAKSIAAEVKAGKCSPEDIDVEKVQQHIMLGDLPEPDLFIRTSGEQRISNFMLWQLAYAELYFTEVLWPDFDAEEFNQALAFFASRKRRFGLLDEQLTSDHNVETV